MCNVACTRRAEGTGRVRNCATCGGDVTSTAACEIILLHEIMATPPAAQAGQDGSLDMATRVPLGTTGIVPPAEWTANQLVSISLGRRIRRICQVGVCMYPAGALPDHRRRVCIHPQRDERYPDDTLLG